MLASFVFLTPLAGLVALAVLLPALAFVLAERRVSEVRRVLSLLPPRSGVDVTTLAALAAVVLLLALAASQPAFASTETQRVRTDAQALFVLDISLSMAAESGPSGRTRLERAVAASQQLRSAISEVPSGVATLTDRVLPNLLPVPDAATFDATVDQTILIEQPPPREQNPRATSFTALTSVPTSGYFAGTTAHRAIVLLTDGESSFYEAATIARALAVRPRTDLLVVQFWRSNESVYKASGRPDPNYRPDPASKTQLAQLAAATHGRVFRESNLGGAASALRTMLGNGPTKAVGRERTTTPLAPYIAALTLLPLALIFRRKLGTRPAGSVHGPGPEEAATSR